MASITLYSLKSKSVTVDPGKTYSLDYFFDIIENRTDETYAPPGSYVSFAYTVLGLGSWANEQVPGPTANSSFLSPIASSVSGFTLNSNHISGSNYHQAVFITYGNVPPVYEPVNLRAASITINGYYAGRTVKYDRFFIGNAYEQFLYNPDPNNPSNVNGGSPPVGLDLSGTITVSTQFAPKSISVADAPLTQEGVSGTRNASFTVSLNSAASYVLSVTYSTQARTATAGQDFTPASGTLTFAPGETTKTFSVSILDDALLEGDETFEVILSNPTSSGGGATPTISRGVATATIADDEALIVSTSTAATFENVSSILIPVFLSGASSQPVRVSYMTQNGDGSGSAAGSDYVPASGILTFAPGETRKSVSVQLRDDALVEGNETFQLILSNPTGGSANTPPILGQNVGIVTIMDDDALPRQLTPEEIKAFDYAKAADRFAGVLDAVSGTRTDIVKEFYKFGSGFRPEAFAAAGAFSTAGDVLKYGRPILDVLDAFTTAAINYQFTPNTTGTSAARLGFEQMLVASGSGLLGSAAGLTVGADIVLGLATVTATGAVAVGLPALVAGLVIGTGVSLAAGYVAGVGIQGFVDLTRRTEKYIDRQPEKSAVNPAVQINTVVVPAWIYKPLTGEFNLTGPVDEAKMRRVAAQLGVSAGYIPIDPPATRDVLVDPFFYGRMNDDVLQAGVSAQAHYHGSGWREGRNPNAFFDTNYYLSRYADVRATGVDPLTHYATVGWKEGRDPSADFSTGGYLATHSDVRAAGLNPLLHYLTVGQIEGRRIDPASLVFQDDGSNSLVIGGKGRDMLVMAEGRRGATFSLTANGDVTVSHSGQTDTTRSVEEIRFIDGRMVFDAADPAAAITRLYQAGLGRAPDQGGLNFWIASLQSGVPLADLASSFEASAEFTTRFGAGLSNTDFVTRIYQNVLGRDPDAGGLEFWRGNLDSNAATRGQTLAGISESNENKVATAPLVAGGIWDVSETAAQVARLYDTALGRLPDAGGLGFWTKAIDNGGMLLDLANGFLDSPEFRSTYGALDDRGFVSKLYDNTLHRPADAEGLDFWAGRLGAGTPRAQVVMGFSESTEHQTNTMPNIMNNDPRSYGIKMA